MKLRLAVLGVIVGTTFLDQGIAMDDPAVNSGVWQLITEKPDREIFIPHNSIIDKTMLQGQTVVFVKPKIGLEDASKIVSFKFSLTKMLLDKYLVDLEIVDTTQLKLKFTATHYFRNDFLPNILATQSQGVLKNYPDYATSERDLSELEKNTPKYGMSVEYNPSGTNLYITHGRFKAMSIGSSYDSTTESVDKKSKIKIFFEKTKAGDINFKADFVITINK